MPASISVPRWRQRNCPARLEQRLPHGRPAEPPWNERLRFGALEAGGRPVGRAPSPRWWLAERAGHDRRQALPPVHGAAGDQGRRHAAEGLRHDRRAPRPSGRARACPAGTPRSWSRAESRTRPRSSPSGSRAPRRCPARISKSPVALDDHEPRDLRLAARRGRWGSGGRCRTWAAGSAAGPPRSSVAAGIRIVASSIANRLPEREWRRLCGTSLIRSRRDSSGVLHRVHRVPADRQRLRIREHAAVRAHDREVVREERVRVVVEQLERRGRLARCRCAR